MSLQPFQLALLTTKFLISLHDNFLVRGLCWSIFPLYYLRPLKDTYEILNELNKEPGEG